MIQLGVYNNLKIARQTANGFYLSSDGLDSVLLPNAFCTPQMNIGDSLKVFVFLDTLGRPVATTQKPVAALNEIGYMRIKAISDFGAHADWGLLKDLFIPFREQEVRVIEGRKYPVLVKLDEKTNRLFGTTKVDKYLSEINLNLTENEEVNLFVLKKTNIGFKMAINHQCIGVLFFSDVHQEVYIGDQIKGYIKTIRPDGKIDLTLEPKGYVKVEPNAQKVLELLLANKGFLPYHDKTNPETIQRVFGMSKKTFKQVVGKLYKDRKISIEKDGLKAI